MSAPDEARAEDRPGILGMLFGRSPSQCFACALQWAAIGSFVAGHWVFDESMRELATVLVCTAPVLALAGIVLGTLLGVDSPGPILLIAGVAGGLAAIAIIACAHSSDKLMGQRAVEAEETADSGTEGETKP